MDGQREEDRRGKSAGAHGASTQRRLAGAAERLVAALGDGLGFVQTGELPGRADAPVTTSLRL